MTEVEWLSCADPETLLQDCRQTLGSRRERLFGVAVCVRMKGLLSDPASVSALELAEAFADQESSCDALRAAADRAAGVYAAAVASTGHEQADRYAAAAVAHAAGRVFPSLWALRSATTAARLRHSEDADVPAFAALLRDIVGPLPFRPMTIGPSWLTPDVLLLAAGIYDEKAFDRMPILADALQDVGCEHEDVLNHCRSEGPHVRGCWVIDLLTGRK